MEEFIRLDENYLLQAAELFSSSFAGDPWSRAVFDCLPQRCSSAYSAGRNDPLYAIETRSACQQTLWVEECMKQPI